MNLLASLTVVGVIVLAFSIASVALSGHWSSCTPLQRALLLFGGPVDGMLTFALLSWLDLSTANGLAGGVLVGLLSMMFLQPMVLPQRLLVWRLAKENLLRRRRQTALMVAGLVIASAIITSSLVVGDSLDATVAGEVSAAWGETDVLVAGIDPQTGTSVEFREDIGERLWQSLLADSDLTSSLNGRQYGVSASVSLTAPTGLAEPTVALFAHNASVDAAGIWSPLDAATGLRFSALASLNAGSQTPYVVLNEVAAEMLEIGEGDILEMGLFVTEDGQRIRTTHDVVVHAVVPNAGQGAMAGTLSPAVFLDLVTAQDLMQRQDRLTSIALSLDNALSDEAIRSATMTIEGHLNEVLTGEDAGLVYTIDGGSGSLSISSETGLQRLAGDDIVALRENISTLAPNTPMLEVLQVPLVDVEVNQEPLLTLVDRDVTALRLSDTALWHAAATGVGFESLEDREAWIWQVEEGGRVADIAWNGEVTAALIASNEGLVLVDEGLEDEEERAVHITQGDAVAVAAFSGGWFALEEVDGQLFLNEFTSSLEFVNQSPLNVVLPSTVLAYDLLVESDLFFSIEGLLSTDYYRSSMAPLDVEEIDESAWPDSSEGDTGPTQLPAFCDEGLAVSVASDVHWCTSNEGLLRYNSTTNATLSQRLPVLSDAEGFGRFPQMFLAFGGENITLEVDQGNVLTSQRLNELDLVNTSSPLLATGILPYAYGNDSTTSLMPIGSYTSLPGFEQLADLDAVVLGLVNLSDAEVLALAGENDRSLVMFSSPAFEDENGTVIQGFKVWFDERSTVDDLYLNVRAVKLDAAEQAEASSGLLSAMFLVFGTFTIAAGVLLSLTIIMLLADVRRTELATARALGLRRSDARAMFVYEGTITAVVSGALGSLLGLVLAWVISVGFTSIFQSVGAQSFTFAWTWDSFVAGWIWGALLSVLLLTCSAVYNAQLNIVRALKGGRPPLRRGVPWGVFLVQIVGFGMAGLCATTLVLAGLSSGFSYVAYVGAGVGLVLLLTPLLTWQIPVLVAKGNITGWTRFAPRNTLGALGVLFLLWTLVLAPIDPLRQQMEPNELTFIVLGLLQVLSGVLVLTSWAPMAVQWLSKKRVFGGGPVRSVALAHPLAHPVRTAVVMGMFSITMFSVVVLAGYTEQFDTYSSEFVHEAEGEFELLLTSSRSRPIALGEDVASWGLNHSSIGNIDAVGSVYRAPVHLEDAAGERMPYLIRGVDDGFIVHGGLPLHLWDESLGATSEEAWISIGKFNDIVFLDASFGLESTTDGAGLVPLQFSIGDSISLIDFSNPQNTKEVRVGGFLKQSSYIFSPGVWMNGQVAEEQFGAEITRMYVSVSPDAKATSDEFATVAMSAQGKSVEERRAAAELEDVLDRELASLNINVQTVADEIMIIQSLVLAILSLFEGYLALGLIVGVAGIGVVTVRNVSERRRTVGMLRAIGFRQRHVLRMFSIEVSWVAVLGMLNGLVIGYGFHLVLYTALWKDEGVAFAFPWLSTLAVFVFGWLVVLVTTAFPVRQAANIPPSAALRTA